MKTPKAKEWLKEQELKSYMFSSNAGGRRIYHKIEYGYGCTMQVIMLWRLIHKCNQRLNKTEFKEYCKELRDYIEEQHTLNQEGKNTITHYSSISMEMEILSQYLDTKFGTREEEQ
jgi:predicted kinase